MKSSVVLIGMPGCGKSTVGVVLAKVMGYHFIDSDLVIQEKENRLLKDIISEDGLEQFIKIENRINSEILTERAVIATGGSVIYGKKAMEHLCSLGNVVYFRMSYETIEERLGDLNERGVALRNDQTLKSLYEERCPYYEKYSDIIIDGDDLNIKDMVSVIVEQLENQL